MFGLWIACDRISTGKKEPIIYFTKKDEPVALALLCETH